MNKPTSSSQSVRVIDNGNGTKTIIRGTAWGTPSTSQPSIFN